MYIVVWSKIRESLDAEKAENLVKTFHVRWAEADQNLLTVFDLFFH